MKYTKYGSCGSVIFYLMGVNLLHKFDITHKNEHKKKYYIKNKL